MNRLEGLHPAFLTLMYKKDDSVPKFYANRHGNRTKAGLLASPLKRQPSHLDRSRQWRARPLKSPLRKGLQRRDRFRF